MDSSLQSFILTGWKMAYGQKKVLSKEKKKKKKNLTFWCECVLLICILNTLIKIISKLLTTSANGTGHENVFLPANAWHLFVSALAPAASWHTHTPPLQPLKTRKLQKQ